MSSGVGCWDILLKKSFKKSDCHGNKFRHSLWLTVSSWSRSEFFIEAGLLKTLEEGRLNGTLKTSNGFLKSFGITGINKEDGNFFAGTKLIRDWPLVAEKCISIHVIAITYNNLNWCK